MRSAEDRAIVGSLFEAQSHRRTWMAVLAAAGCVFLAGWAPAVAGLVLAAAFLWIQFALVRPAARLFSVRRRIVAVWTFNLAGASFVAINIGLVELLTLIPLVGHIGKTAASALQVAVLAWAAKRYLGWQARREERAAPIALGEYLILGSAVLVLVLGVTASLSLAFWVTSQATALVAGVDTLATGPSLSAESLRWSSVLALGAATGTRASLFLLVSGAMSIVAPGFVPQQLQFLGTPLGLGAAVALLVIEFATERDDDLQTVFGIAAGGGRVAAAAVLGALGSGHSPSAPMALLAGAAGAGVAVLASASRHWLHALLRQLETEAFSPRRWLNRLEEGGVAGLAVAVYAGPMLALALAVVGLLLFLVGGLVARTVDRRWRRPCPTCGFLARVEASGCPGCGRELPVARSVASEAIGLAGEAWEKALGGGRAVARQAVRWRPRG